MTSAMPFEVRSEFSAGSIWEEPVGLRRYEVSTPEIEGPLSPLVDASWCIHGSRASMLIRLGGGHLRGTKEELAQRLSEDVLPRLGSMSAEPSGDIDMIVKFLEDEQGSGYLERAYITASLIAAVSATEVWSWLVSPHGLAVAGQVDGRLTSTDLRYPVLRKLGVMKPATVDFPATPIMDEASSIFCVGTPLGYERLRSILLPGQAAVALDRGGLPFGPWPSQGVSLRTLWRMEAAWKHGLAGRSIVVGPLDEADLNLPDAWTVREVPLGSP